MFFVDEGPSALQVAFLLSTDIIIMHKINIRYNFFFRSENKIRFSGQIKSGIKSNL